MKINWKKIADVSERTLATFVQAFLALALVTGLTRLTDLKVAAVAGGFAAAKYVFVEVSAFLNPSKPVTINVVSKASIPAAPVEGVPSA